MHAHEMAVFGISAADETVYRHFLRNPDTTPGHLHRLLDLGEETVRATLDKLAGLGLLRPGTAPGRITPATPETAVARLAELRLRELYQEVQRLTQNQHILATLRAETPVRHNAPRGIEQLDGWPQIRDRIDDLAFFTRHEVLYAEPMGEVPAERVAYCEPLALRALRRGVRIRAVVPAAALDHQPTAAMLSKLVSHGARMRIADTVTEHVLVFDGHSALMPLDPWDSIRGALLTRGTTLVANLVGLFEKTWEGAEDIGVRLERPGEEGAPLSDGELRVLQLMCTVGKDEAGARGLGVSVRTYRRYIADVMRRLGATSRAQAALLARERGWI
ncbi:helix-turn-helix transcriptional regulator [Streptomyces xiamenensis]